MVVFYIVILLLLCALAVCVLLLVRKGRTPPAPDLEARLKSDQQRLRDFALLQLVQGRTPEFERVDSYYRLYGLNFPGDAFMLLTVKVRSHCFGDDPQGLATAYNTVREELTGILGLYAELCFAELDGVLVCFYCEPRVTVQPDSDNQPALRELLIQHCEACAASMLENSGIDALIAVGHYDVGGFGLHTSFLSTKALLEQAMLSHHTGNVVSDADELSRKTDAELADTQRQFYNYFVCFKYADAADCLFHMVELRISHYYDTFTEAREIVAHQLTFCTNMLELPLNVAVPLSSGGTINIRDLMASDTPELLRQNLMLYFAGLETLVGGNKAQAAPATQRVYRYIEQNYTDPALSVSSLGEQFHLNVSYLSRQFKQEYNVGVLELIHKVRIARAKELLAGGTPPADVYEQVGYTSRRAFDSAFSRYEGITPKAYQDQLSA